MAEKAKHAEEPEESPNPSLRANSHWPARRRTAWNGRLLDVPEVEIDELVLDVQDLLARVAFQSEVLNLQSRAPPR